MILNKAKMFLFFIAFLASASFFTFLPIFKTTISDYIFVKAFEKQGGNLFLANIAYNWPVDDLAKTQIINCDVLSKSAIVLRVGPGEQEKVIYEKQAQEISAIASLTKLMTAIIANEFYNPNLNIVVSKQAVSQAEITGNLTAGEVFNVAGLTAMALIESSNDAAFALTVPMQTVGFIDLMNYKAKELGLNNTMFFNPTGLDENKINYSTAFDLANMAKYIVSNNKDIAFLTTQPFFNVYTQNNLFHHTAQSTNLLLYEFGQIILGKTGYTDAAGECLLVALKGRKLGSYYIYVVLGSSDRFSDVRDLIACSYNK